ncbi:MAG: hypothetical protein U9N49_11225 [Campylobacterota bacterium]|nr:hypothetical protein [Campylobacterota bacterium]
MFIIDPISKADATGELKLLYRMIERQLGFIPPHFEMMATIDTEAMKSFLEYNHYMITHPKIDKSLMPFLRLYIAQKECREYCTNFNREMLLVQKVDQEIIDNFHNDIALIPLKDAQKLLLNKVIKAIYQAKEFGRDDLKELYAQGFSDKDFFDILSYASEFMGKSKIIEAYRA